VRETVKTVDSLAARAATPLKRGVNESEMSFLKRRSSTRYLIVESLHLNSGFGGDGVFVEDENAMGLEIEISGNGCAGEEIMHGFVKLDAEWRGLMI